MPDTLDLQSDQFMTLLTDALRSGPGSPEWHQAVKTLRSSPGGAQADEYQLLYAARERLEAGKEYRSVRAGPGFTRKVMQGVDEEGQPAAGLPTANIIALLAAGAILVVVIVIGISLLKGSSNPQQQKVDELGNLIFGNKFLSATFGGSGVPATNSVSPPSGWSHFGDLALATTKQGELRPSTQPSTAPPPSTTASEVYRAGGLVSAAPIPADQPLEVDVTLKISRPMDDGIVQIFVSDEPITDDNAAGGHALVWQLTGAEARIFLANGQAAPQQGEKIPSGRELQVKLALNRDTALAEITPGGAGATTKRQFAGPHALDPSKPRYAGLRFLRRAASDKWEHLGVVSITLQKP
jgi:hypothetical protein